MNVPRFIPNPVAIYGFLTDKTEGWFSKVVFFMAVAYVVNPADFDWIPVIGWVDDALVGMLALCHIQAKTMSWQEKQLTTKTEATPQIVEGEGVTVDVAAVSTPNDRK